MTGGNTICRALPKVKTAAVLKSVTATITKSKWHKNFIDLASLLENDVKGYWILRWAYPDMLLIIWKPD